nr:proteoglycan 3 [Camelus dromedarius]
MKGHLLLPLLLLGTVSALYLENDALHLGSQETQADMSQDLEISGEQEGELALKDVVLESEGEGEEANNSSCQDTFEDEEAMESDPGALDEDLQCPREEDTVQIPRSPGCQTCRRFLLVRTPRSFRSAQNVCRRCYRGNLVSIHHPQLQHSHPASACGINQAQVWIGAFIRGWFRCRRFRWTDGSRWNFGYWASGQPGQGRGRCVALCTKGGHWRLARCKRRLPFVCAF